MNRVYFDIETERAADEVGGWRNIEQLGIAVVVTCASRDDKGDEWQFKTFLREDIPALLDELNAADVIVGFNSRGFDFPVLQPFADFDLRSLPDLDLMADIKRSANFRAGLGNCCEATFGESKSSNGLESLQWWREGRRDEVIAYCRQDVALTRRLHEYGARHGFIKCRDKTKNLRSVTVRWSLDRLPGLETSQQGSLF